MEKTHLKIGLLTGEYPPMEGGVGAFTQALAKELTNQGHDPYIITSIHARPPGRKPNPRNRLDVVELGYAKLLPVVRHWKKADIATVASLVERHEFDVVNIQYQPSAFNMRSGAIYKAPKRIRGMCPVITTFHDLREPYLFPKAGSLRKKAVQRLIKTSTGVIGTNSADYAVLSAQNQQHTQIPIGSNIAVNAPSSADIRAKYGIPSDATLLGYFGFLNESKGADTLIRTLAKLPDAHLIFIGGQTGASDENNNQRFLDGLKDLATELGVAERIHWSGYIEDQAVSDHLHACDLLTLLYKDGVSLRRGTLMAGLAHGRPIISTQSAETTFTHGENIWLVAPENPQETAEAIRHLMAHETLRAILGRNAQTIAQQFSWKKIAAETVQFIETILP